MKESKFWKKVGKCKHDNLSETFVGTGSCSTPYCSADEEHCLDCGVYISSCQCNCCSGMSGWSHTRWNKYWISKG